MFRFTATLDNSGALDPSSLPKGYAYATLGPNSLVDQVSVGGMILGPRSVVPIEDGNTKLMRVRPTSASMTSEVVNSLELCLWEKCETPVPTKRNGSIVRDSQAAAAAAYALRLRLPFAGRQAASLHMIGTIAKLFDWAVLAIRYGAVRDQYFLLDSGSFTPSNEAISGNSNLLAQVKLAGGTDSFESYDELQLWYKNAAADQFDCEMEAYDTW